tara:strand:- start:32677 stop:33660 length:984 start_codon:yes stop_codon:yes gene_type:complete
MALMLLVGCGNAGQAQNGRISFDADSWPDTDFSRSTIDLAEVMSGGVGRDAIPSIDSPQFVLVSEYQSYEGIDPMEPVVGVELNGAFRAYPLRVMIWHEIVNDVLAGVPIAVTYCPLCNTSVVFDRRFDGRILDFGTTGNLRHSDLIMYDRQSESWWQQYGGQGIVGRYAGDELTILASRLESLAEFAERAPQGQVLVPNNPRFRDYSANPYVGYDRAASPMLFRGKVPRGVSPMLRVIAIEDIAFALPLLQRDEALEHDGLSIRWSAGQRTALGHRQISRGADVGSVLVQRRGEDVPHVITFAFAFFAFHPDGVLYTERGAVRQQP